MSERWMSSSIHSRMPRREASSSAHVDRSRRHCPMRPSERELVCLSCGVELVDSLRHTASLRCHDCRDVDAPISSDFVRRRAKSPERSQCVRSRMLSPSHEPRPNVMSAVASFIEFPVRHEYDGQLDYTLFGGVAKFRTAFAKQLA